MPYRFVDSFRAVPSWSCSKAVYKPVWHIPLLSVRWVNSWWWTEELSKTCRVSWQNKFVKLVHLVGFITKKKVLKMFVWIALDWRRNVQLEWRCHWTKCQTSKVLLEYDVNRLCKEDLNWYVSVIFWIVVCFTEQCQFYSGHHIVQLDLL